ncbi:hypothetical protein TI05_11025 [Achromatium sp. WMS3]|nr:hypothetical protein TI05_11025 [Achromatium sp. WMS3]
MKGTRIVFSHNLNQGKYEALNAQARLLGQLRSEIWQRFGSINGVGVFHRTIRDEWVKIRNFFPVEELIAERREAAKDKYASYNVYYGVQFIPFWHSLFTKILALFLSNLTFNIIML